MTKTDSWPALGMEAWMLSIDAWAVIGLRTMRLMGGGAIADREASRMVEEKLVALWMLPVAMMSAPMITSAPQAMERGLAHYGKTVRANRRRLSRAR